MADFHALRHTFITNLANSGSHPKVAQILARHSTITLTMDRYTHSMWEQLTDALAKLPDLGRPIDQQARATGTEGKIDAPKRLALCFAPYERRPPLQEGLGVLAIAVILIVPSSHIPTSWAVEFESLDGFFCSLSCGRAEPGVRIDAPRDKLEVKGASFKGKGIEHRVEVHLSAIHCRACQAVVLPFVGE